MVKRVADDMRMTCTAGCFCRFQEIPRFQGEDFAFVIPERLGEGRFLGAVSLSSLT